MFDDIGPFLIVVAIVLIVLTIVGVCLRVARPDEGQSLEELLTDIKENSQLQVVEDYAGFTYYRDVYTDVMYCKSRDGNGTGLTAMLDADGTPLLYSEWIEMKGE